MKSKIYSIAVSLATGLLIAPSAPAQWTRNAATSQTYLTNTGDNVGIGTVNPSFKLDIRGTGITTLSLKSSGDNASILLDRGASNKTSSITYRTSGVNNWQTGCVNNNNYTIRNNGLGQLTMYFDYLTNNIGIGTNVPANKLSIAGNVDINGNVGINTSTPAAKLEVAGGDILINGVTVGRGSNGLLSNIALGNQALANATSGSSQIVGVGDFACHEVTSALAVCGVGYYSLASNTTGSYNSGLGSGTLRFNTTGNYNVAIGTSSLYNNVDGSKNTALGSYSLTFLNGIGITGVGSNADAANSLSNATALGYSSYVDASNKVSIGNGSVSSIGGQVGWSTFSDARIKNNIKANVPGLQFINLLKPVTFHYDIKKQNELYGINNNADWTGKFDIEKVAYSGFLAQDVDAAALQIGYDFSGIDKQGKIWSLRYAEFVVPLVKAVQELSAKSTQQQQQIELLQSIIASNNINNGSLKLNVTNENDNYLLGQNIPNPFDNSTIIPFRIPKNCNSASIMIAETSSGKVVNVIPVSCKENNLIIESGSLAVGTYTYTLYVNGTAVESKQMIFNK